MSKIAVVYHSGYGHTDRIAKVLAETANAQLDKVDEQGNIADADWEVLNQAKTIVMGSPTYMGNVSWQFKKFADATSKAWFTRAWQDKLFAAFTVSATLNGDKQVTLQWLQTLASQHGGLWISLGLPPSNSKAATRADVNTVGGSVGLLVQCASDAGADEIPSGDIETTKKFAQRIAQITEKFSG